MLESYWRTIAISKVQHEVGQEYRLLYYRGIFMKEPEVAYFDDTKGVVAYLAQVPHKDRRYIGLTSDEQAALEHVIESTLERRKLMGVKHGK